MPPKLLTYARRPKSLQAAQNRSAWDELTDGEVGEEPSSLPSLGTEPVGAVSSSTDETEDFKEPIKILSCRDAEEKDGNDNEDGLSVEYLVQWRGLRESEATWQRVGSFPLTDQLIVEFLSRSPDAFPMSQRELDAEKLSQAVFNQLEDAAPEEDDPHIDWRAVGEESSTEHDELGALVRPVQDDGDTSEDPSGLEDMPLVLAGPVDQNLTERCSRRDRDFSMNTGFRLSSRYSKYLMRICSEAAFPEAVGSTAIGVMQCCRMLENSALNDLLTSDDQDSSLPYSFIIQVWLAVCLRIHNHERPSRQCSLASRCGTLLLSAHASISLEVGLRRLRREVQFWERRLYAVDAHWMQKAWLSASPTVPSLPPLDDLAAQYMDALDSEDIGGLVGSVLKDLKYGPKTPLQMIMRYSTRAVKIETELIKMCATMGDGLLRSCIRRRVPQDSMRMHEDVANQLEVNRMASPDQPGIYGNYICDKAGMAPSPQCWRKVCDAARLYLGEGVESDELAAHIDQVIRSKVWPASLAAQGIRRYPEWRKFTIYKRRVKDDGRRSIITNFINEMESRVEAAKVQGRYRAPFAAAVAEMGYSIDLEHRIKEHARHISSNYLMNLMHAIFEHVFPGTFGLQQHIIYRCWGPLQPWLGEIFLTQIGQGYTQRAGGFSHYPAGCSNGSAYRRTPMKSWVSFSRVVLTIGRKSLMARLGAAKDKIQAKAEEATRKLQMMQNETLEMEKWEEKLDVLIEYLESLDRQVQNLVKLLKHVLGESDSSSDEAGSD